MKFIGDKYQWSEMVRGSYRTVKEFIILEISLEMEELYCV